MKNGTPFEQLDDKFKRQIIQQCEDNEDLALENYKKILEISNVEKKRVKKKKHHVQMHQMR